MYDLNTLALAFPEYGIAQLIRDRDERQQCVDDIEAGTHTSMTGPADGSLVDNTADVRAREIVCIRCIDDHLTRLVDYLSRLLTQD